MSAPSKAGVVFRAGLKYVRRAEERCLQSHKTWVGVGGVTSSAKPPQGQQRVLNISPGYVLEGDPDPKQGKQTYLEVVSGLH